MNKDLIKKKYEEKIQLYHYYNKKYYSEDTSEVSDSSFDKLKIEITNLEKKYTFLKSKYGEWIVYKPSFTKKNSLLWFIPYAVFIFGGIIIFVFTRKYKNN